MSDLSPTPTPTDEQAFEDRAMRQRTSLTNPSPLLLRVRQHVRDHGGDGKAFDWAVNDHVRAALAAVSATAPDEREALDLADRARVLAGLFDGMGESVIDVWREHDGHPSGQFTTDDLRRLAALAARPAPVEGDREREYQETVEWLIELGVSRQVAERALTWARPAPGAPEGEEWAYISVTDLAEGREPHPTKYREHALHMVERGYVPMRRTVTAWTVADTPAAEPECAPDCEERADCTQVGEVGHMMCGRCSVCGTPRHHDCECAPAADDEGGQE